MTGNTKETSFGIELISALAKKLKATLNFETNQPKGTIALLTCTRFNEL